MKIPRLPDNVKVHPTVWRTIKEIKILDENIAAKIIQRISKLGFDPKPFNEECNSKLVQNLKKEKIYVRRLSCIDIDDYRIFYAIRKSGLICVYAVIFAGGNKHDDAYLENSQHYKLIKLLYTKYWRECQ
jgi:mRNA-degrading endonuclease RelE of RelBE toxin-antitoxin system